MKLTSIILVLIFFQAKAFCQIADIITTIFNNKQNLEITSVGGHKTPSRIYVLTTWDNWTDGRFNIKRNLSEYHEDPYLFKDSVLNALFSAKEIDYLLQQSKKVSSRKLTTDSRKVQIISSFAKISSGFFFTFTQPIYNRDTTFAFIEMTSYYKEKRVQSFRETYYGQSVFIFRHVKKHGWVLFRKQDNLLL